MDAIVLPGCGARGAYQAGVLSTLAVPPLTVGTSAGALNALAHVYGSLGLWLKIKERSDVLTRKWFPLHSVFDPSPLSQIITDATQSAPRGEAVVAVTDLVNRELVYHSNFRTPVEDMRRMALASASIPGAFPPVDQRYVDGGVMENAPLKYAIDAGALRITLILGENLDRPHIPRRLTNIVDTCVRSLDLLVENVMHEDIWAWQTHPNRTVGLRIIQPPVTHYYDTLDFSGERITKAFALGQSWQSHNQDKYSF